MPPGILLRRACGLFGACSLIAAASAASIESVSLVFKYPKGDPYDRQNLHGFNHAPNVTTLPDGSLLAAWFSGAYEGDVHQLVLGAASRDGGKSWSAAVPLVDLPRTSDFDPAFVTKGRKTWMLIAAGRWNRYPWVGLRDAEQRQVGMDSFRLHLMHTVDSGRTWSEPTAPLSRRGFCRGNGTVLRNGAILFPVYDDVGKGAWTTSILRSTDDGASWHWTGQVGAAEGKAGGEPTIAELDNGHVLAAMRSRDGHMWFAESPDAGDTWGQPSRSDFNAAASSHALFRTKAGRVFLAYNACKPPERTALSIRELDQTTKKWGVSLEVAHAPAKATDAWGSQVAYPSIAELADGTLVLVWTEISLAPQWQTGIIRAARIRL